MKEGIREEVIFFFFFFFAIVLEGLIRTVTVKVIPARGGSLNMGMEMLKYKVCV